MLAFYVSSSLISLNCMKDKHSLSFIQEEIKNLLLCTPTSPVRPSVNTFTSYSKSSWITWFWTNANRSFLRFVRARYAYKMNHWQYFKCWLFLNQYKLLLINISFFEVTFSVLGQGQPFYGYDQASSSCVISETNAFSDTNRRKC